MKVVLIVLLLGYSSQTFAYLDPGSASLIIQGLIAAIASGVTVITLYWSKFKSLFQRKPKNLEKEEQGDSENTE